MLPAKRFFSRILFVSVCLFFCQQAFCWGVTGHRTIAQIAESHLSKKAKKELKKLIGKETLAWWANWPDFIKSDSTWDHASPWHYINVQPGLSKDSFVIAIKDMKVKNLYGQIKETMAEVKNKSLSDEQRKVALRFLIHLVGDLHQPLHVGRAEDQGGNKIPVFWFDRQTNLHSVWDNSIVDFQQYSYSEYAHLLDIANEQQEKTWESGTLEDWLYESHLLANRIYASANPGDKLGYKYNYQFQNMLNEQLLKGGIRLGKILTEVLE